MISAVYFFKQRAIRLWRCTYIVLKIIFHSVKTKLYLCGYYWIEKILNDWKNVWKKILSLLIVNRHILDDKMMKKINTITLLWYLRLFLPHIPVELFYSLRTTGVVRGGNGGHLSIQIYSEEYHPYNIVFYSHINFNKETYVRLQLFLPFQFHMIWYELAAASPIVNINISGLPTLVNQNPKT